MNRRLLTQSIAAGLIAVASTQLNSIQAAGPDAAQVAKWLDVQVLDKDVSIDEVRAYVAKKIPKMPALAKPEDWTKFASEHRKKVLDQVIFKGEAAKWRDSKT